MGMTSRAQLCLPCNKDIYGMEKQWESRCGEAKKGARGGFAAARGRHGYPLSMLRKHLQCRGFQPSGDFSGFESGL